MEHVRILAPDINAQYRPEVQTAYPTDGSTMSEDAVTESIAVLSSTEATTEVEVYEDEQPNAVVVAESREDVVPSALTLYLREVRKIPLLDKAQEAEAARRKNAGDKEAFQRLYEGNLRLVISKAKKYVGRGVELEDLIQEGNLGLLRAVELYDHQSNARLATYASWWIVQSIGIAIAEKSRTIRVPDDVHNDVRRYNQMNTQYQVEHEGAELPLDEVGTAFKSPARDVASALRASQTTSLNIRIGNGEVDELGDMIPDEGTEGDPFFEYVAKNELYQEMAEILLHVHFTERQRQALLGRFGIGGAEVKPFKELAAEWGGVSLSTVQTAQDGALKKIRKSPLASGLREFL